MPLFPKKILYFLEAKHDYYFPKFKKNFTRNQKERKCLLGLQSKHNLACKFEPVEIRNIAFDFKNP